MNLSIADALDDAVERQQVAGLGEVGDQAPLDLEDPELVADRDRVDDAGDARLSFDMSCSSMPMSGFSSSNCSISSRICATASGELSAVRNGTIFFSCAEASGGGQGEGKRQRQRRCELSRLRNVVRFMSSGLPL